MSTRYSLVVGAFALTILGCNSTPAAPGPHSTADASAPPPADAGPITPGTDGGGSTDAQSPQCFTNPTTYLEIINACTDAQAIDKQVDLSSMNLADGGLQPLP